MVRLINNYNLTFAVMAILKDYYKMLNVKSSASPGEIKTAYRRLAMKYHPDRNPDDALAAAVFADVAEAYGVLSDDTSRKEYNHKRYVTAAQEYQKPVETIENLIMRITEINRYAQSANAFHLNKEALFYSIKQLIPDDIDLLLRTNANLLEQFLIKIYTAAEHLSPHQTKQLLTLFEPLYLKHAWLQQKLVALLLQQQKKERWEKNKIVVAIAIALILCLIIFFTARK